MDDFFDFVLVPIGILIAILVPMTLLAMWLSASSCSSQADKMGFAYSWGPLQDCMIRVDDRWEPMDWQRSVRIKP